MLHCTLTVAILSLFSSIGHGLKISPPGSVNRWNRRQASQSTSPPSTTTIFAPDSNVPSGASTCVCRLVQPFNQYITLTSQYAASRSDDGTSTSTLGQASGTTPGTILIVTPTTYSTVTQTSGTQVAYTSMIVSTLPDGSATTYVLVNYPELSTSTAISGNAPLSTGTTSTTLTDGSVTTYVLVQYPELSTTTRTGGSMAATNTVATGDGSGGTTTVVVVDVPLSTVTSTSGSVGYTSTITTTDANQSPSAVVVVNQPALCGTQGWQWAYARIPLVDHGFTNDFDFSTLQNGNYLFTAGTTSYIGLNPGARASGQSPDKGPNYNFYGQYTDSVGEAAVNHRAFFVPPTTGTYTFTITQADDQTAIYIGDAALRGYNNNNELVETSYGGGAKSAQRALNQYSCNPIRVLWIDGSSPGNFNITITGPNGVQLQNGDYVRNTCCGNPYTFSAFGSET